MAEVDVPVDQRGRQRREFLEPDDDRVRVCFGPASGGHELAACGCIVLVRENALGGFFDGYLEAALDQAVGVGRGDGRAPFGLTCFVADPQAR